MDLSSDRLRKLLKKADEIALRSPRAKRFTKQNYRWKRTRQSHRQKQDPLKRATKQADLDMLQLAAASGEIELKYLDEAGCCLWSPVSYSYSKIGIQKRQEQTAKCYGKRISILGLWQPGQQFEYALAQSGFNSDSYIQVMNWIADKAELTLATTGRVTVVVQDNGSLHTSQISRQQSQRWLEQGLIIFFLPPYCSEMNPIEAEWHQLKSHELAGQMFDNEYDLAGAIMDGIESRGQRGHYSIDRFIFNCT